MTMPLLIKAVGATFALWLIVVTLRRPFGSPQGLQLGFGSRTGRNSNLANSTLGFQKIYAISLPQRTDRQDALTLMSSLTGLHIEISPGLRGEDVLEKTIPKIPGTIMGYKPGFIGSWRAHLNVMKRVVDQKIASALVIEDDVDWDVSVREQMARILAEFRGDQAKLTEGWDVLWLGNVGERFPTDDPRKIVFHDPTVPPRDTLSPGFNSVKTFPEQSRVIHPSDFPLCSYAYAVSYAGAQKILYHASLDKVVNNFDNDLANNCWVYMNCISVTPPLFHFDRNKGMIRDSDTDQPNEKHFMEPGSYKNVQNSVRLLMKENFGKQFRKGRVWRDDSDFGHYFVEAMDLPGQ